jgi:DME family drug/metabolite transporter
MFLGLVLVALAAMSWGTTGATMTLLSREAAVSPLLVGWSRLAIAAPLLVLAATGVGGFGARHSSLRPWPSVADLPLCAALGVAMAAYQVCYFRAVTLVGVAPLRSSPSAPLRS